MTWLLDTNVISEFHKPRPAFKVGEFLSKAPPEHLFLSAVTVAEILFGARTTSDAVKRAKYLSWLETGVRPFFADRIIAIDEEVLVRWQTLIADAEKRRLRFPVPDSLIAAVALARNLVIVSRNTRDFVLFGVPVFNPWTGESFDIPR